MKFFVTISISLGTSDPSSTIFGFMAAGQLKTGLEKPPPAKKPTAAATMTKATINIVFFIIESMPYIMYNVHQI